jgi:hypothetical protein
LRPSGHNVQQIKQLRHRNLRGRETAEEANEVASGRTWLAIIPRASNSSK